MTKYDRPSSLDGATFHIPSGCGTVHITVNFYKDRPVEVYAKSSTKGGCGACIDAIGRSVAISLQSGAEIVDIMEQLSAIRCPTAMAKKINFIIPNTDKIVHIKSCPDAIGKAIKMAIEVKSKKEEKKDEPKKEESK